MGDEAFRRGRERDSHHSRELNQTAAQPIVGFRDADRLFAELARAAEQLRAEIGSPGFSIALKLDGELVWSNGFGLAGIENQIPARANAVYRIASISKTFGAAAVLQLVDTGKVSACNLLAGMIETASGRSLEEYSIKWIDGGLLSSAVDLIRYSIAVEYGLGWELQNEGGAHYTE